MVKEYQYDPTLWVGYTRKVAELLDRQPTAAEYRAVMQMYIKKATAEEVVAKLESPTSGGLDLPSISPEAFDQRQAYIDEFGSVLNWALSRIVNNWRIRKRLPRLTAKAKALGLIVEEGDDS